MFKAANRTAEGTGKRKLLRDLIESEGDECRNGIIFCNRKVDVDTVAKSMKKYGLDASPIHGDLDQSHRMRTLDGFRDGSLRFLVASDVAARGLDIPNVSHVFNYDVPSHAEDYVHRIGRTGRAGKKGTAIMICSSRDEKNFDDIERLVEMTIPRIEMPGAAPAGDTKNQEAAPSEDKPKRTRSRGGRGRKGGDKTDTDAAQKGEETPAPDAQPAPPVQQDAAPAPKTNEPAKRGNRGRGGRDNRGGSQDRGPKVVGMGDDAAPILFGFLLSGMMSAIVSAIATYRVLDAATPFARAWLAAWGSSWLVAFPVVLIVAPITRRLVARMTRPD